MLTLSNYVLSVLCSCRLPSFFFYFNSAIRGQSRPLFSYLLAKQIGSESGRRQFARRVDVDALMLDIHRLSCLFGVGTHKYFRNIFSI
jgi:hypothetical protein